MYRHRPGDFVLSQPTNVVINESLTVSLNDFSEHSCYMDTLYPLFSSQHSVRTLILQGLKGANKDCSPEDIKKLFYLDDQRFERPLSQVGNERFRSMAAIGYTHGKQVFCFPWFSQKRFEYYHENLTVLLEILKESGKIVILPVNV